MSQHKLAEPFEFKNKVTIPNRLVMAPMVARASEEDGYVSDDDLKYFALRSEVAGMIITGAAYVIDHGKGFGRQLSIAHNDNVPGLTRLSNAIKKDGAKAIVQLYHGGRESHPAAHQMGYGLGPSAVKFDWLPYDVKEMTLDQIDETIAAFAAATRRAIDAGFDGVEVHGANHYLLQQFFSVYSNHRDDEWGGDLARRMAFPLAVLDAVMEVAKDADRPFIVGYRISPEEVHGDNVGYNMTESLALIDAVANRGVDYVHVSLWEGFDGTPMEGDKPIGKMVKDTVAGRCPVIVVSNVFNQSDAQRALEYGDLVAIGRAALIDPQFGKKVITGRGDEIETSVAGRVDQLAYTEDLVEWFTGSGKGLLPPLKGLE